MLDLELMKRRSFVGVLIAGVLLTFSAFAAFTYVSIWLQSVLGMSPIESGLVGLPMSAMAFIVSASIGRFLHGENSARSSASGCCSSVPAVCSVRCSPTARPLDGARARLPRDRNRCRAGDADPRFGCDVGSAACSAAGWLRAL